MRYGSVCSGIEAATAAWHPLGWEPAFFSEIEAFPRAVLAHHYPDVPLHGDFTTIKEGDYAAIDLLVGGTPCQSFSVAGLRKGLDDDRGNLALEFCRLALRLRPKWVVWENVPGVLSMDGGRAFASILGGLAECGYGLAYRVLDAQFVRVDGFGRAVPQRRRRVFVVGCLGDWRRAAAVLFERASLSGNTAPRREAGKATAPTLAARTRGGGGLGTDFDCDGGLVAKSSTGLGLSAVRRGQHGDERGADRDGAVRVVRSTPLNDLDGASHALAAARGGSKALDATMETYIASTGDVAHRLNAGGMGRIDYEAETMVAHALRADGFDASEDGTGRGTPIVPVAVPKSESYGDAHADATEANPDKVLRSLREAVGEEAYSEWGVGIVAALRSPEVLRSKLHGSGVRCKADDRNRLDDNPLSCSEDSPSWAMQSLWEAGCIGCAPPGWRPPEQLSRKLGEDLSFLSQPGASPARFLLGLWRASEGLGLLREALSAVQEVWRPDGDQGQPAHRAWAVRRLTPREAERLQGFPDDFTAIPMRNKNGKLNGKWAKDGPRYKALGNSMAVNVMRWIGRRIEMVEAIENISAEAAE